MDSELSLIKLNWTDCTHDKDSDLQAKIYIYFAWVNKKAFTACGPKHQIAHIGLVKNRVLVEDSGTFSIHQPGGPLPSPIY